MSWMLITRPSYPILVEPRRPSRFVILSLRSSGQLTVIRLFPVRFEAHRRQDGPPPRYQAGVSVQPVSADAAAASVRTASASGALPR
jgi:hypothetical protein